MKITYSILAILFVLNIIGCSSIRNQNTLIPFYIGTTSQAIYTALFDTVSGQLSEPFEAAKLLKPSFIDISPDNSFLVSVSQTESSLSSYIHIYLFHTDGILIETNSINSRGASPCYVSANNKQIFWANYLGATTGMASVNDTIKHIDVSLHSGTGPDSSRQNAPHAHFAKMDNEDRFLYSTDLGADKIYIYDVSNNTLNPSNIVNCKSGSGPRHIAFHPNNQIMAVINELNNTITTYKLDSAGMFTSLLSTINALPDTVQTKTTSADIHFSHDGNFCYASNRGFNSLTIYKVNISTGVLENIGSQTEGMNWPRNFVIDPSDSFVLVANQKGDSITIYKRNKKTGLLSMIPFVMKIPAPTCIRFMN